MFEEKKENLANWAALKLEEEFTRKVLIKIFIGAFIGNLISWIIALYGPDSVAKAVGFAINIEGKILVYLLILPLACAFLMTFAMLRLCSGKRPSKSKDNFLDGYQKHVVAENGRLNILISAAFAGLNVILLVFAVASFRNIGE